MKEEREIKDILLQYTCPAYPPEGVSLDRCYFFGKDDKGFYYSFIGDKTYCDISYIKMLFTPKKTTWDELLK